MFHLFESVSLFFFFFFNDTATTEIYTLSLHDALPISDVVHRAIQRPQREMEAVEPFVGIVGEVRGDGGREEHQGVRSEEHTSELQSPCNLVCRLLLEKKKNDSARELLSHELGPRHMTP